MVLRFGDLELCENPLPLDLLREISHSVGGSAHFQGPVRISKGLFAKLYTTAFPSIKDLT